MQPICDSTLQESLQESLQEAAKIRKTADAATRAACDMLKVIRQNNLFPQLTKETMQWIRRNDR